MERQGAVDRIGSGRWRTRVRRAGRLVPVGIYDTEAEAEAALQVAREELAGDLDCSLAVLGPAWLDRRELAKHASIATQRSTWKCHIATAPFYRTKLARITRPMVRSWMLSVRGRVSEQTTRHAVNLLSKFFDDAIEDGRMATNPAKKLAVPKEQRTQEPWTYLTPDEIADLLRVAEPHERSVIAFAIGTGLREGEMAALELRDLHVDGDSPHVYVRFGGRGKPPKWGKLRSVPLTGMALEAAKEWLAMRDGWVRQPPRTPPSQLVFPTVTGCYRRVGRFLGRTFLGRSGGKYLWEDRFQALCRRAGLYRENPDRPLVWHSLRHTCASGLVSGYWGPQWPLQTVQALLGHQSITTTERYAHLAGTAVEKAARVSRSFHEASTVQDPRKSALFFERETGLEPATLSLGSQAILEQIRELSPPRGSVVEQSLGEALAAGRAEEGMALARLLALDELSGVGARLALEVLAEGPHALDRAWDLVTLRAGRAHVPRRAAR